MHVELHCGDCLELLALLEPASVDLILADLPYGTTRCKWDSVIPFEPLWEGLYRVLKPGRAIAMTCVQPFTTALISSNMERFAYDWTWNKKFAGNYVQAKRMPLRKTETVAVFGTDGKTPRYFPIMEKRDKPIFNGGNRQGEAIPIARTDNSKAFGESKKRYDFKYPSDLIEFSSREDRKEMKRLGLRAHPTQKPVSLFEYLIKTYSEPGEVVLDCCMGSGSSGVASARTGRSFIGFDLDPEWHNAASVRIAASLSEL